jgi:uncharacterized protein YjbJ (UPF0337 family)
MDEKTTEGKVDRATGKLKEGVGKATDNESLEQEGKNEQAKGHVKEGVAKFKDAIRDQC